MSGGVSGDFGGLADAVTKIGALEGLPDRIADRLPAEFSALLDEQFSTGVDPYGDPWAPLADSTIATGRSPPPLTDTGAMHASAVVSASGGVVTMSVDDPAGFHQTGTRNMPAREVLPTDARGLPPAYELAIVRVATEAAGFEPESK
jgi:hypothetical protein